MTPSRWPNIETAFLQALDLESESRARFLASCDPDIRGELESLLAAHVQADRVLPVIDAEPLLQAPVNYISPGDRYGVWRIVRKIAEGGMGVVYLAERADGQFEQQAAIKFATHRLLSEDAQRRFRIERQILAQLDHPNIVRLLDGGVTADGTPYLVMEYISGRSITNAARELPLTDRLCLFQSVCAAIHYAHQNLVVHRDIKPGNIFVTDNGTVKVLDFGIAKLLATPGEESTGPATTQLLPMTPDYASPEQVRGAAITTASDIYSLGLLLYEIVSGKKAQDCRSKTLDQVLHIVCTAEPPHPAPSQPDLNALALKAIRKEPDERYASAQALAEDIDRFLDGRPILARDATAFYLLRRLITRHKRAVAGVAVLTLTVLAGAAGIAWQARIAETERARAERRFNQLRQISTTLIFDVQEKIAPLAGSMDARKLLIERALSYLETLRLESAGDPTLALEIARAYLRVGRIQGGAGVSNLGDSDGALRSFEKARMLLEDAKPTTTATMAALADNWLAISGVHHYSQRFRQAIDAAERGVRLREQLLARRPDDYLLRNALAAALLQASHARVYLAPDEAATIRFKALKIWEKLLSERPDNDDAQRNIALVEKTQGAYVSDHQRRHVDAIVHFKRALALDERRLLANPADRQTQLDVSFDFSSIASALYYLDRHAEAEPYWRRVLSIRQELARADPRDFRIKDRLAFAYLHLGLTLEKLSRIGAALTEFEAAIGLCDDLAASDRNTKTYQSTLAVSLVAVARLRPSGRCATLERAAGIFDELRDRNALLPVDLRSDAEARRGLASCLPH